MYAFTPEFLLLFSIASLREASLINTEYRLSPDRDLLCRVCGHIIRQEQSGLADPGNGIGEIVSIQGESMGNPFFR